MFFFILFACLFYAFEFFMEQKHDWLKKVKFVINRAINLEHFVNKFHSASLIIFFIAFALQSLKINTSRGKFTKKVSVSEVCFYEFLLHYVVFVWKFRSRY